MTILVAAAVIREGPGAPVLLTQRIDGHLAGMWEFPGGKLEAGESPEEAVVRECEEEIALTLRVVDVLDVAWHAYPTKSVLLLFYDCRIVAGEIEHREVGDHAWVEPARLPEFALPPPDARLVAKLMAGR